MNRTAVLAGSLAALALALGCHRGPTAEERVAAKIDYQSGVNSLYKGDMQPALNFFRKAEAIFPDDAKVLQGIGLAYVGLGEPATALDSFRRAVKVDPSIPEIQVNMSQALLMLGRYQEAIEAAQRALDDGLYQTPAAALFNIAAGHSSLGDLAKAEEAYQRAIKLEPAFDRPYYALALMRMKSGRYEEAAQLLTEAVRKNPNYFEAYYELGLARYRLGDAEGAQRALRRLLEVAPEGTPIREQASQLLETLAGGPQ